LGSWQNPDPDPEQIRIQETEESQKNVMFSRAKRSHRRTGGFSKILDVLHGGLIGNIQNFKQ
jgi:hypothetical protein